MQCTMGKNGIRCVRHICWGRASILGEEISERKRECRPGDVVIPMFAQIPIQTPYIFLKSIILIRSSVGGIVRYICTPPTEISEMRSLRFYIYAVLLRQKKFTVLASLIQTFWSLKKMWFLSREMRVLEIVPNPRYSCWDRQICTTVCPGI